jgi:peptide/nickel transport system permease protein
MRRYFAKKISVYLFTFWVAVTIDWGIPRILPGNPLLAFLSKFELQPDAARYMQQYFEKAFGFNQPLWKQYLYYWDGIFHWNLGTSMFYYPTPVTTVIGQHVFYTMGLLVPAIVLAYFVGNRLGALAARRRVLDNSILPGSYVISGTPYQWFALLLAFFVGAVWHLLPESNAFFYGTSPVWTWTFIGNFMEHWILPFLSLFFIMLGGWAIGMRNLIIYELESDYAHWLQMLGSPARLVRRYAYRNAVLPQLTGLALALGTFVAGQIVTEVVFNYPGVGLLFYNAITNSDIFLMQGVFLLVIMGVLIANFLIDIVYVLVDPRTRVSMMGAEA